MTLEEAIARCEKIAIENHGGLVYALKRGEAKYAERCKKSMDEFRQLAEWLKELAERRKLPEIIYCRNCENWDTTWQNDSAPNYHYCPIMDGTYSGDFYCAKAERRGDANNNLHV